MIVRKILGTLSPHECVQAYWLILAIVGTAILEAVGVASIIPFMSVLANPDAIATNDALRWSYNLLPFKTINSFLIVLGCLFLGVLILANSLSALTNWLVLRFTYMRSHTIAERLLARYLTEPYVYCIDRNTTEMGKNILVEVGTVVGNILLPTMRLIAKSAGAMFIIALLLMVDAIIAVSVTIGLGLAYGILYAIVKKRISRLGEQAIVAKTSRFKLASESLAAKKEIDILGVSDACIRRFSERSLAFAKLQSTNLAIAQLPKYAFETIAFGGMLVVVLLLLGSKHGVGEVLPLVSVYAFAGYRLMPAVQQIFASITSIRFNLPALDVLDRDLRREARSKKLEVEMSRRMKALSFEEELRLEGVSLGYPGCSRLAINGVDMVIRPRTMVGFVGETGSGKTTTADIILGLLMPVGGQVRIDGVTLTQLNVYGWQRMLGYVPQSICLWDDSIWRNIALGIPDEEIDPASVLRAARIANLHEFVEQQLPKAYQTVIGERGVRLSGGERQRIGLARALYRDPDVLILDEATSALDNTTESIIMQAIRNLSDKKTIIIVAHRLSTVRNCDVIYVFERGQIVAQGSYDYLVETCQQFRDMSKAGTHA